MRLRVIAVDDDVDILSLIRNALEPEGFDVTTVETVDQFRKMAYSSHFDVALIDLNLGDGNGLSLIREARDKLSVGIIVLSGRTSETDHVVALELGADDFVSKPFRLRELAARISAVSRRIKRAPDIPEKNMPTERNPNRHLRVVEIDRRMPNEIKFGDYVLKISARTLKRREVDILLTSLEFNLLLVFLEHRGVALNRDRIMTLIRGSDWESYDRAIDGLVSRLRRKIPSQEGSLPYIRTVHGVGYIFIFDV